MGCYHWSIHRFSVKKKQSFSFVKEFSTSKSVLFTKRKELKRKRSLSRRTSKRSSYNIWRENVSRNGLNLSVTSKFKDVWNKILSSKKATQKHEQMNNSLILDGSLNYHVPSRQQLSVSTIFLSAHLTLPFIYPEWN